MMSGLENQSVSACNASAGKFLIAFVYIGLVVVVASFLEMNLTMCWPLVIGTKHYLSINSVENRFASWTFYFKNLHVFFFFQLSISRMKSFIRLWESELSRILWFSSKDILLCTWIILLHIQPFMYILMYLLCTFVPF